MEDQVSLIKMMKDSLDNKRLRPNFGDMVTVLIHHHEQEIEVVTGLYLDGIQLSSYTTPFYVFYIDGVVRMVNSNAVREFRFEPFEEDHPGDDGVPWGNFEDDDYYDDSFDYPKDEIDF